MISPLVYSLEKALVTEGGKDKKRYIFRDSLEDVIRRVISTVESSRYRI